jgi:hypothetical protein
MPTARMAMDAGGSSGSAAPSLSWMRMMVMRVS